MNAVTNTVNKNIINTICNDKIAAYGWDKTHIEALIQDISSLRGALESAEQEAGLLVRSLHPANLVSARNLIHYLALRRHDLRPLQEQLANLGLSSLGRTEAYVLDNLDAIERILCCMAQRPQPDHAATPPGLGYFGGRERLETNTRLLLGPTTDEGRIRIMVTMSVEASTDYDLVRDLIANGMDCMRINCAHDSEKEWAGIIANKQRAEKELGRECHVLMDLGGPKLRTGPVSETASHKGALLLHEGDTLTLTREPLPGEQAQRDDGGQIVHPAHISSQSPEIFAYVRAGERVWLNDGKIGGVVSAVSPEAIQVKITQARTEGEKLRAEKGINLPDSDLRLPALMEQDAAALPFIAIHADMVGYSFVQSAEGVHELQARLEALTPTPPAIILKIETQRAFTALPELLLAVMRDRSAGVMIARGDLAVELGYERMAEVQEEILWICEAAHLPVIWATQVLENLAQKGLPSRAEITDAAMGVRAECVMLNKGPYIVEAVCTLDNILLRMQTHQSKKRTLLRELHAWAKIER